MADQPEGVSSRMHSLAWIRLLFHPLRASQQKTLAFFVDALLVAQDVRLAAIARNAASLNGGRMRYTLKRLWRFLANDRFQDEAITRGIAEWIWPRFNAWKQIPIAIDWTHNEKRDGWATLAASVTLNGRGIPLMMWSFRKGDYDEHLSRNHCEQEFIERLFDLLPDTHRVVLIADRGFARVNLLKWLHYKNIAFVIRVPRSASVSSGRYSGPLRDLGVANGECYSLGRVEYTDKAALGLCQLVVAREQQATQEADPWFLATNLSLRATTVTKLCARRMVIEEDFREAKSRLDWSDSRIRKLKHYRRMTSLVMVVLVFAALVGRVASRRPTLAEQVARRRKEKWDHGYTAMGLALLRRSLRNLRLLHQAKLPAQPT